MHFSGVVGVQVARCPGNGQGFQAGVDTQALQEVDRRDHGTGQTESFLQCGHRRRSSLPPGPDGVGWALTGGPPCSIYWMIRQDRSRFGNEITQQCFLLVTLPVPVNGFSRDVVGWGSRERCRSTRPNQQVTITHPGIEPQRRPCQSLLKGSYEAMSFLIGDMPRRIVDHADNPDGVRFQG